VADLKCYLCGHVSGSVEGEQARGEAWRGWRHIFLGGGADRPRSAVDIRSIRCARCRGPVYLDDTQFVTRRIERTRSAID